MRAIGMLMMRKPWSRPWADPTKIWLLQERAMRTTVAAMGRSYGRFGVAGARHARDGRGHRPQCVRRSRP